MMLARTSTRMCRGSVSRPAQVAARPAARSLVQLRAVADKAEKADKKKSKKDEESDEEEEPFFDGPEMVPTTTQVQAFLTTLCGDTDIAQVELKLGGFAMKVRRSVEGGAAAAPAPAPAAAAAAPAAAPAALMTNEAGVITPEDSVDEALVYVTSPKVGIFRRGKYAANKRVGKDNLVKDGDVLKKGQTVAYVEQLGTFVEIKAPQAGEVAKFRVNEGDAVEYGQTVLELAPFFGGHIIGDSKYA